ncbi:MAG: DEAD/DEAH box helicase [Bacteroidetes bacterium]|nr:DEAD/DEAH box helicase [Bacteroidota bacterium]MBK8673074.1 DEAD/DEAH box helicase [Bacteroidota bacterium]
MDAINQNQILQNLEISELNKMQIAAAKAIAKEDNIILLSKTGSGKTLAYLLPILHLLRPNIKTVQTLILVPSRELAIQIEKVWKKMGTGYKINLCYGGHDYKTEQRNLSHPPAILVGTPGRVADHISKFNFSLVNIQILVLDEFDKSLELGFQEEMDYIISRLRALNKRILVSATKNMNLPEFTGVKNPKMVDFLVEKTDEEESDLTIKLIKSPFKDKINSLFLLLCQLKAESALIFCNFRESVERTQQLLADQGLKTAVFHGGMDQEERENALILFRNGTLPILITTDLAARGLDIPEMKNVIHYQLPPKIAEFTHRNGRTARMNQKGTVFIILNSEEKIPGYLAELPEELVLSDFKELPNPPDFSTVYISGGKKQKINKIDIVGFFCQKGNIEKSDIGLIEVKDHSAFVAIKKEKVAGLLKSIGDEKLKGKSYKIKLLA